MTEKKFIIWDPKDNYRPRCDDDGNIVSDGVTGRIGEDNVYLTTYADYPRASKKSVTRCLEALAFTTYIESNEPEVGP